MQDSNAPRIDFLRAVFEDDVDKRGLRTKTVEYGIHLPFTADADKVFACAKDFIENTLQLPELALKQTDSRANAYKDLQVVLNGLHTFSPFWEMSFTTRCNFQLASDEEYEQFEREMERKRKASDNKPVS